MKSQVLLVDMRSTEKLSHHHVKTVVYDHWFAVHSRARCKTDTQETRTFISLTKEQHNCFCFHSRTLTGNVVKPPEDHLHMIPHIQGAEPRIRLSEGHELIPAELVGLHRHRVEREGLVNSKIYGETTQKYNTYQPRRSATAPASGPKRTRGNLR